MPVLKLRLSISNLRAAIERVNYFKTGGNEWKPTKERIRRTNFAQNISILNLGAVNKSKTRFDNNNIYLPIVIKSKTNA